MGGLIKWILAPGAGTRGEHPSPEALARLVDDLVDGVERAGLIRHLNRCQDCYEILSQSLAGLEQEADRPARPVRRPWWRRYALAASVAVALIGYGLYFHGPLSVQEAPVIQEEASRPEPKPRPMAAPQKKGPMIDQEQRREVDSGTKEKPLPAKAEAFKTQGSDPASPTPRPAQPLPSRKLPPPKVVTLDSATGRTEPRTAPKAGQVGGVEKGAAKERPAPEAGPKIRALESQAARQVLTPARKATGAATRLKLDPALAALLTAGRAAGWRDRALVDRLAGLLRSMGARVSEVERVVVAGPGTGREVEIRQEGSVLHLSIIPYQE